MGQMAATAEPAVKRRPHVDPQTNKQPRNIPPYNVVLLNDDDHTYDYVIEMLGKLFGHSTERAYQMAVKVDTDQRVIVDTTTKERAEFKRDQILAYGADHRLARSTGSMQAVIEPAAGSDDDDEQ